MFTAREIGGTERNEMPIWITKCSRDNISPFALDMCGRVKDILTSHINEVLQKLGPTNPLKEEITRHALFYRDKTHSFQGRADILHEIHNYLSRTDPMMPLVIYGESGVGKTSLMAKVVADTEERSKDRKLAIVYRFCGTTPDSSTGMMITN